MKTQEIVIELVPATRRWELRQEGLSHRISCMLTWCEMANGMGAAHPNFPFFLGDPPAGHQWDLSRPFRIVDGKVQGVSTCGLFAERLLELAGFDVPWVGPYKVGSSISRMVAFARNHKAWKTAEEGLVGEPTVIGPPGKEHVVVPIKYKVSFRENQVQHTILICAQGGQVGKDGLQLINIAEYARLRAPYQAGTTDGPVHRSYLDGRPVLGSVAIDRLPTLPTATYPTNEEWRARRLRMDTTTGS